MSEKDDTPFSLQEISNAALDIGVQQWSPAPCVPQSSGNRAALACVVLASVICALFCFAAVGIRNLAPSSDPVSAPGALHEAPLPTLEEATSSGSYFYILLRKPTDADLVALSALRARGATVTLAAEEAPAAVEHFRAPPGSLTTEGVIVDGAQWRAIRPR